MSVIDFMNKFSGNLRLVVFDSKFNCIFDDVVSCSLGNTHEYGFSFKSVSSWDIVCVGKNDWIKVSVYLSE